MVFSKPKRYVNDDYREFIKNQPCCISETLNVDPHHIKSVGSGGSDLTMIPLSHELHAECHKIGKYTFQKKYDINFHNIMLSLLQKYIKEKL
jgi:hypothetical protein